MTKMNVTLEEPQISAELLDSPQRVKTVETFCKPLRVPLSFTEEIFHVIDQPEHPPTIMAELRVTGSFDEDRLRRAIATAIDIHPMARARLARARFLLRPPEWVIETLESSDALSTIRCEDDSSMPAIRSQFCSQPIDLRKAPALRLLLVRRSEGDSLLISIHHALSDGLGGFRFVNSIIRAYAGQLDPISDVDPLTARDIRNYLRSENSPGDPSAAPNPYEPDGPVSLLAPEGAVDAPGYGIRYLQLTHEERKRIEPMRFGARVTLNDFLITALHLTIDSWNSARQNDCHWTLILMPVNIRPRTWAQEVMANLVVVDKNATSREHRSNPRSALDAVIAQTHRARQRVRLPRRLLENDRLFSLVMSLFALKSLYLPKLLRRTEKVSRTTLLTNIGRLDRAVPPQIGGDAGEIIEFWPSAPALMPWGLTMTSATYRGNLQLTVRYCRKLLSDSAAESFLALYRDRLIKLSSPEG